MSITDANYFYSLIGYDLSIAVVICFNVCVHLFFLIRSSFVSFKKKYKNKICRRRKKRKKVKTTFKSYDEDVVEDGVHKLDDYSAEMEQQLPK